MVHRVIYPHKRNFNGQLAILTIREHLCGFYELKTICADAGTYVDPETGHVICSGCRRRTLASGLSYCDLGEHEFINLDRKYNNDYETICPRCAKEHDLDEIES